MARAAPARAASQRASGAACSDLSSAMMRLAQLLRRHHGAHGRSIARCLSSGCGEGSRGGFFGKGGRFVGAVDPLMKSFNESIHFDKRLCYVDLQGSRAYAMALERAGILTTDESEQLVAGLHSVRPHLFFFFWCLHVLTGGS
eukprot:COSAG05_NODE_23_length_31591_cov_92.542995_7_plen_143_part_00